MPAYGDPFDRLEPCLGCGRRLPLLDRWTVTLPSGRALEPFCATCRDLCQAAGRPPRPRLLPTLWALASSWAKVRRLRRQNARLQR